MELGYCNVGYVECVGDGVTGFGLGDRVVSNGSHAEYVLVPKNLCAKIPESISSDAASFTILGAIGLQGIRLLEPKLGECVVVFGLGVIGLLTVQMLIAQGCRVVAVDFDSDRLMLAEQFGAKAVVATSEKNILDAVQSASRGYGADGAIITASTESDQPIRMAAHVSRKRGRIVLVGVAGLHLNRADFYEKELSFQVSCSYGPGRYDASYEENGNDYPIGYVRWTEQRNFEAVLDMMAAGAIDVSQLIRIDIKLMMLRRRWICLTRRISRWESYSIFLTVVRSGQLQRSSCVAKIRGLTAAGEQVVMRWSLFWELEITPAECLCRPLAKQEPFLTQS